MKTTQEQLFKNVFKQHTVSSENKMFLKNITIDYPYFGLAHFYALKNSAFHDVHYNRLAAKTKLFFDNPFYFSKILLTDDNIYSTATETSSVVIENNIVTESVIEKQTIFNNSKNDDPVNASIENNDKKNESNEVIEPLPIFKSLLKEEPNNLDEKLLFEPLYTSDYFASQGIKLSEAILANDKLGTQLKSFTSWLKTMKKAHPEKQLTTNVLVEAQVQKHAENSNIETEVYTESMAEAFAIQGKNIRAMEVYAKLSLMFPEKSAYFAHKIENLK